MSTWMKSGARIVTNTSAAQLYGGLRQFPRIDARHAQIDRFGLHVQAVLGDSGRMRPESFVRRRRAITANDVDLAAGMPDRERQIGEDIIQARIEMVHVACPVITQEIIELGERFSNVLVAMAVNNVNPLTGVPVVKKKKMILAIQKG